MMKSIVEENPVSFKELEQKIFQIACDMAIQATRSILELQDEEIFKDRDRSRYRDKGRRTTTVKTIYGEVTFKRHVYQTLLDDGSRAHVYLLDEALQIEKVGLLSSNLAEKIATAAIEMPFRRAAAQVSATCGQTISHGGTWNFIQRLGERIDQEEKQLVRDMEAGQSKGTKQLPVLFEEMDGVFLKSQASNHKKTSSQEIKLFTMYEGWDKEAEKQKRSKLVGKRVLAGTEDSEQFHQKREAFIRQTYDADEIGLRILNGDGGSWIREDNDPEAIHQLDRYHINQAIKQRIKDPLAQCDIHALLNEGMIEELLQYLLVYADSVDSNDPKDRQSEDARILYKYLANNKESLLPYRKRGIRIPRPLPGIRYKGMGVQENQNCTLVTMRMKGRRMRWGTGANNLVKVICRRENKELGETIDRYADAIVSAECAKEILEPLSAGQVSETIARGKNPYAEMFRAHLPLEGAIMTPARKALVRAILG